MKIEFLKNYHSRKKGEKAELREKLANYLIKKGICKAVGKVANDKKE